MTKINSTAKQNIVNFNNIYFKNSAKMTELKDDSVNLILTSPPYFNIKKYYKNGKQTIIHSKFKKNDIGTINSYSLYLKTLNKVWIECERVLAPNGKLMINVPLVPLTKAESNTHHNRDILNLQADIETQVKSLNKMHLLDVYIWKRINSVKKLMFGSYPFPNNFYAQNLIEFLIVFVKEGKPKKQEKTIKELSKLSQNEWIKYTQQIWEIPIPNKSNPAFGIHPALMPLEIIKRVIKLYSFVGDLVLDPFAGSGSTLSVAYSLGRNFVGYEIYDFYKKSIYLNLKDAEKNLKEIYKPYLKKINYES